MEKTVESKNSESNNQRELLKPIRNREILFR